LSDQIHFQTIFPAWGECLIHPLRSVGKITASVERDRRIGRPLLLIWLPSVICTILIQVPITHSFGIEWNNVGFHAFSLTLYLISLVAGSVLMHISMRLFKLRSILPETLSLYTITAIYSPITNIFQLRSTYQGFEIIKLLKKVPLEKLTFLGVLRAAEPVIIQDQNLAMYVF